MAAERRPMAAKFEDSASHRWLSQPVLETRLLDNMESLAGWTAFTNGPVPVTDARETFQPVAATTVVAEIAISSDRTREGRHSLRLRTPTRLVRAGPENGLEWGNSGVVRHFRGEDWTRFNRLSVWIYPDCPGSYMASLELWLHNDGAEKLPAAFGQEGQHSILLRNQEWNHVVWQIGNVARDKVIALEFSYLMGGNEPEAADTATYYFDHLELQRVEPDYVEGWGVWPGRISYSHAGYQAGTAKSAIATGLNAREFRLTDQRTGETLLNKPVQTVKTHLGTFQVMDFSEVRRPGSYSLEAGGVTTRPFPIDTDVWREPIWKALNFFYVQRCGIAIPGVHGVCHRDWQAVHGDKRIVMNGGWHDAGDLSQGLGNTGEVAYGMFSLAERLHARGEDPELYERLLEEANWGLDWILKTRFGDGFRGTGSINSRRTNGILGDGDDPIGQANNDPSANLVATATEAIGSRVMKEHDPRVAAYALKCAEADWRFAIDAMGNPRAKITKEWWRVPFDSDGVVHERAAEGVLASVELWRATGKQIYADKAVELAQIILDSQERKRPNWTTPLLGFFYTDPAKDRILHYCHRGREHGPVMALTQLCQAFPNHRDWMKWYSAVVLYAEYLKTVSRYTEPYGVLPASIYRDDEYLHVPESRRESFRRQVLNGVPLGAGHYLRLMPVWMDYRGHFGTILPQTQALASAAHLRGDLVAAQVSERQLEWIIGRNPFAQSAMWGEGHDFVPLYSACSGDIVGALSVGIQTRGDHDVPYWPVQSYWTYKEVWVHPVGRWIWAMRDLAGPALVEGETDSTVEFRETSSEERILVKPDAGGVFRAMLPEGTYRIRSTGVEQSLTLLPGATYHVDLRVGRALDFAVTKAGANGDVTIKVTAQGTGDHRFALRADNLILSDAERNLTLAKDAPGTVEWRGRIESREAPWVAVIIPDGDMSQRREIRGEAWEQ